MPYVYRSNDLQQAAVRGRRAMRLHPDRRSSDNWEMFACDMIADILHGLNSRVELEAIQFAPDQGAEAILRRAFMTFTHDFDSE